MCRLVRFVIGIMIAYHQFLLYGKMSDGVYHQSIEDIADKTPAHVVGLGPVQIIDYVEELLVLIINTFNAHRVFVIPFEQAVCVIGTRE
mgnify:CR=1 FL=1